MENREFVCFACDYVSDYYGEFSCYDGDTYCNDCFNERFCLCDHCNDTVPADDIETSEYGRNLCSSCADDYRCPRCGTIMQYTDSGYCEDCSVLKPARWAPEYWVKQYADNDSITTPVMGVELEVELESDDDPEDAAIELDAAIDARYIIKRDGSLRHGFEIVSHPASLEFHRSRFPWREITRHLDTRGAKSHDTTSCGLHIHANRDALPEGEWYKIAFFWYSHDLFFQRLCRREPNQFCKKHSNNDITDFDYIYYKQDRYYAINISNDETVEFRQFRGTLKVESLYTALETVHSLISWITHTSTRFISANPDNALRSYLKYVTKRPKKYPNLIETLKTLGEV